MNNASIPIFISSPNDVAEERGLVSEAVRILSPKMASLFGISLNTVKWEEFSPISSGEVFNPQYDILKRIEPNSIFVGLLHRRKGTVVNGENLTGTELEFQHAIENRHRIKILTYFRDPKLEENPAITVEELDQLNGVMKLRKTCQENGIFYQIYGDLEEFKLRIQADIMEAALQMILRPRAKRLPHYAKFFQFGLSFRQDPNPILIVYPPISDPNTQKSVIDIQRYLLPRIVYEDHKAIQKVENAFRIMGKKYQTTTIGSPELEYTKSGDRVWICLSRNKYAQEALERIKDRVRFSFEMKFNEKLGYDERFLIWETLNDQKIKVRSPLIKYLECAERPKDNNVWEPKYGYTFAKDYGILARFKIPPKHIKRTHEQYYHYFIGGIRGLGTWGVGWYIDHFSEELTHQVKKFEEIGSQDIQILLEVTYKNYRIQTVSDVSNKGQEYFDRQIDTDHIKKVYQEEKGY